MQPEQDLKIYELRALNAEALEIFNDRTNLSRLGPALAGIHWETDFAFIFFKGQPGPGISEFLYDHPELDLKHIHELTYGQWQDGAGAAPFEVQGLTITGPECLETIKPQPGRNDEASQPGQGIAPVGMPNADASRLIIDPGLAFGFGGHPTTHSCLEFLARVCRAKSALPGTALDLGSGTGVLSLAAARWGILKVTGVDYSHLATDAALNNLRLNRLEGQVEFVHGPAQNYARHPAELLMANLHLSLQEDLLKEGAFQERRAVIISGLLPSEGDSLLEKLTSLGLRLVDQMRTERWITMLLGPPGADF